MPNVTSPRPALPPCRSWLRDMAISRQRTSRPNGLPMVISTAQRIYCHGWAEPGQLMDPEFSAEAGSDTYYAGLYYQVRQRHRLQLLYTVLRELQEVAASCSDRGVAQVKLAWWHDEIERTANAQPRHKLTLNALAYFQQQAGLAASYQHIIAALAEDLIEPAFDDAEQRLEHLRNRYRDWLVLLIGAAADNVQQLLLEVFVHTQSLNHWCDFRRHQGLARLPADRHSLQQYGVSVDTLRYASRSSEIRDLLKAQLHVEQTQCQTALAALARSERKQYRFIVCLARCALATAELTADSGYRVLEQRVQPTPVHKLWDCLAQPLPGMTARCWQGMRVRKPGNNRP